MTAFAYTKTQPLSVRTAETVSGTVTTTYIGNAIPGSQEDRALWQLQKVVTDTATGTTSVTFAEGSDGFRFVWTNRETYVFS